MSAFKGTPGPWTECGHQRGGCICGLVFAESSDLAIADASLDCDEETRGHRPDEAARKANARLIAAAPELLEVAKHCEDMLTCYSIDRIDGYAISDAALVMIRAAIAKATGGAA